MIQGCMKMENTTSLLRVSHPLLSKSSAYDTAKIENVAQYGFLRNIYSPLVEFDNEGRLQGAVASSFLWNGNELSLKIRDDLQTVDGKKVTADDALFSLKRVIVLSQNTHGNIATLLCPNKLIKSVDEECENARVEGNTLVIKADRKKPFVLPMLTSLDFAIIPKRSVDLKTLKIIDFRNTTGPYYVERDFDNTKTILLSANKHHYAYTSKISPKIQLFYSEPNGQALNSLLKDEIDFVTTIEGIPISKVFDFVQKNDNFSIHQTLELKLYGIRFTDSGIKRLSQAQRYAIASKTRKMIFPKFKGHEGFTEMNQLIPVVGEGSISSEEASKIRNQIDFIGSTEDFPPVKFAVVGMSNEQFITILKEEKKFSVYLSKGPIRFIKDQAHEPDVEFFSIDSGYQEDVSLLSFSMNIGHFGYSKSEGEKWLDKYMNTEEKAERLKLFREIHKNALKAPFVVPIMISPVASIIRKGWKTHFSQFYIRCPLWMIEKE